MPLVSSGFEVLEPVGQEQTLASAFRIPGQSQESLAVAVFKVSLEKLLGSQSVRYFGAAGRGCLFYQVNYLCSYRRPLYEGA